MDRTRLKNIILLILLLMNAVLLCSLASVRGQERSARERTARELTELFASEDIALEARIPSSLPPASVTLSRDLDGDRALAAALLGDDLTMSNEGGGIYIFTSSAGQALFRSNGVFEATGTLARSDAEAVCRKFCQAFGYQDLTLDPDSGTGSAVQYFDGSPVSNASVDFAVSGGSLVSVSGAHLPQTASASVSGGSMSAVTALTKFLNARRDSGAVVSAVTEVYLCYELQSTAAAPMSLVPAWCVVTDTGNYYVNCLTEAVTRS
ncbi:MAG: hypothetical protein ACI4O6_10130 [Dysosmobacter sp.]